MRLALAVSRWVLRLVATDTGTGRRCGASPTRLASRHSSLPRRPGNVRSGLACWSHGHERTTGIAGCPRRARGHVHFVPWGKSFDGARRGSEPVRCPARGAPAAYRHTRPGFKKSAHVRLFFLILGKNVAHAIPVHRPSGLQAAGLLG